MTCSLGDQEPVTASGAGYKVRRQDGGTPRHAVQARSSAMAFLNSRPFGYPAPVIDDLRKPGGIYPVLLQPLRHGEQVGIADAIGFADHPGPAGHPIK